MVQKITDEDFEREVKNWDAVLIDFYAKWCGPCKVFAPILEEISVELEGKVKVFKMDIDDSPNTPSKYSVRSIPTVMLFEKGNRIDVKVGSHDKKSIVEWIKSSIKL